MNKLHTPGPWGWSFLDREVQSVSGPVCKVLTPMQSWTNADARLIAAAPELNAYRQYIEGNLERIERGGWTPVCFDEFRESEECANAIAPPYCEHCEGNGYVQCDYDETTPCTHCLDGREVAEQEEA